MAEEKKKQEAVKEENAAVEQEKIEVQKEVIADAPKDVEKALAKEVKEKRRDNQPDISSWNPKTELGKKVKENKITSVESILDRGMPILESEIVDSLIPDIESDLMFIGQSKGKFGGGSRRVFKQTQKKTREGNKPSFATFAVVGNKNGLVGIGYGKSKETVPAREKALRNAKQNVFKIRRGCGSWQCNCKTPHSIPFKVSAKVGSVEIELIPAPKGKGLIIEKECQKMLSLAGVEDVWSKTKGQTKVKQNLLMACELALRKLIKVKIRPHYNDQLGIVDGAKA